MPKNVEIKAAVKMNFDSFKSIAKKLCGNEGEKLVQHDIFYKSPMGRLKLRSVKSEVDDKAQLIYYKRPDQEGPKLSDFSITPVVDLSSMNTVLSQSMGKIGEVKKTRYVFIVDQTRIHADQVDGLGNYMELEVMMKPDQSIEEGEAIAHTLMKSLCVDENDLITGAYMDMILKKC